MKAITKASLKRYLKDAQFEATCGNFTNITKSLKTLWGIEIGGYFPITCNYAGYFTYSQDNNSTRNINKVLDYLIIILRNENYIKRSKNK